MKITGRSININVSGQSSITGPGQNALLKSKIPGKRLKRRLVEGNVLLNFWDLGQIVDGLSYIDIDFSYKPTMDYEFDFAGVTVTIDPFDWSLLNAYLLGQVVDNNYDEVFKKLGYEEAERYAVDVMVDEELYAAARDGSRLYFDGSGLVAGGKWTEDGLEVPKADGFSIRCFGAFNLFTTDDAVNVKITDEPLYSADEVPFSLNADCDIFLVPAISKSEFLASSGYTEGGDNKVEEDFLNYSYFPMRREHWLENTIFEAFFGTFPLGISFFLINNTDTTERAELRTIMTTDHGSRLLWTKSNTSDGIIEDSGFFDPTTFPISGGTTSEPAGLMTSVPSAAGALIAVIRKGETWFYVWAKTGAIGGNQGSISYI